MRDDDKLWDTIHLIAADLIIYHSITDKSGRKKHPISNEIEKTMHHITNSHAGYDDVLSWLHTRMIYANYFERTKQTITQLAVVHEVIGQLKGFIDDTELAPSLGWIAQLMSYYAEYTSHARQRVERMSLFQATLPEIVEVTIPNIVKKKPVLRPQTAESQQKAEETLSAFEEIWAKRAAEDDNNDKAKQIRSERRKQKKRKKK